MSKFYEKGGKWYVQSEFRNEFSERYIRYGIDPEKGYPKEVIIDMLESTCLNSFYQKLDEFRDEVITEQESNVLPMESLLNIECLIAELKGDTANHERLSEKINRLKTMKKENQK